MYQGRSIGRMLEWLRELQAHSDHLIFHPGGKITLWDQVVIERTEWDECDNPKFIFVNESDGEKEARDRAYLRIREREFHRLCYTMHPDHIHALEGLENLPVMQAGVHRNEVPQVCTDLVALGMATKKQELFDWDDKGAPLFDINIEISPQGRGFLHAYQNKNPWED